MLGPNETVRQRGVSGFAEPLNKMGEGQLLPENTKLLQATHLPFE